MTRNVPVCHELFSDPKLLPCGHLLCRHCLISWLQSKAQAHCPLCRCVIVDPEERTGGKNLEDIADGFPTDLAMAALVESQQLLSKDHCLPGLCDAKCYLDVSHMWRPIMCQLCHYPQKNVINRAPHCGRTVQSDGRQAGSKPSFFLCSPCR